MPCLNEADTLQACIQKALSSIKALGIAGEVVVADNGSTDGSVQIAEAAGARVVHVAQRGYGSALMGGIEVARGKYVVMGDADDSYDFLEIPKFFERLNEGYDLVQGCRLPSGGGDIRPGAMPFLHRLVGNPLLSFLVRLMFRAPIHDVYCGMRGFTKALYQRLGQRCTGMEFATEMIIKSSLFRESIAEVPITLHPDGRKAHAPHLRTFRDGWRTLRLFLLYSPRWLFLVPGMILILIGIVGYALAMLGVQIGVWRVDLHTMLFASLFVLMGYQAILFAVMGKVYAIGAGLIPLDSRLSRLFGVLTLERGLIMSALVFLLGIGLLGKACYAWWAVDFGDLEYSHTMRWVISGAISAALGFQSLLFCWFISILGMDRK
ncbi:MAG: glycosyltransferase family 2 protein [Thermodesulfobacteriota bacterium]|nr:glycosyltransferase family 2 protein [Thermodesulfobacteriota bacterium]